MKITQVTKTGSVPEMSIPSEDKKTDSPSTPGIGSTTPDHTGRRPWWTVGSLEDSPSEDIVQSVSAPTTPHVVDGIKMAEPMAKRGRLFASRLSKRRLVQKNGDCNVKSRNVTKRNQKYMVDIFTTLVDMRWRYHLLLFALAFIVTWCFFGGVWYAIAVGNMDDVYKDSENWTKCVDNVFDYNSALLFSIETQTTIGYGFRVIQPQCRFGIFVMMLQSCLGLFIQSLITGIIFSKLSRPKGRAQTIMFSEKAAICKRDGEYCLTFRVGDMRKSHIISTSVRALLVKNRLTTEGESIPLCQYPLNLETETSKSDCFVFLIWPVTVVHRIDSTSPLWELSLEKLLTEHFEIIVILEGTVESTGMSTQVRTSYIPSEIMWGERLVPLLTFQLKNGHYEIDYEQFHNTTPTLMPDCSAKDCAERKKGLTDGEIQREADYPVSFTAPAIRPKHSTPGRSLQALFPRSIEGMMRKRAQGKGNPEDMAGNNKDGSHVNRAYLAQLKHSAGHLVNELHHGNNYLPVGLVSASSGGGNPLLKKMTRLQSLEEKPRIEEENKNKFQRNNDVKIKTHEYSDGDNHVLSSTM